MTVTWITRDQWGARQPESRQDLPDNRLRGMAVHYSAAEADRAPDHDTCDDRVRSIQNYHQGHNGWVDIAYNWLVCQHGGVFEGRGWDVRSAANGTNPANEQYHAVCFLGSDRDGRDDVQPDGRLALRAVIDEGRRLYPKAWEVRPHSDFRATACPGNELRAWIAADMPVDPTTGERPADMPTDLVVVHSRPVAVEGCRSGGYWLACEDGGVFTFAGAGFHGSMGGTALNKPIVDMIGTDTGGGYFLVAADGGLFAFGDAEALFAGSLAAVPLAAPVVDASMNQKGGGYWMLGGDGGLFAFGDAPYGGRVAYQP